MIFMVDPPKVLTTARKIYDLKDLELLAQIAVELNIHDLPSVRKGFLQAAEQAGMRGFCARLCQLHREIVGRKQVSLSTEYDPFCTREIKPVETGKFSSLSLILNHSRSDVRQSTVKADLESMVKSPSKSLQRSSHSRLSLGSKSFVNYPDVQKGDTSHSVKKHQSFSLAPSFAATSMRSWRLRHIQNLNATARSSAPYESTASTVSKQRLMNAPSRSSLLNLNLNSRATAIDSFESAFEDEDEMVFEAAASQRSPPQSYISQYESSLKKLMEEAKKINAEISAKLHGTDVLPTKINKAI
ncbi:hypothetical protein MP228_002898 [Amoeboaphelidium protococcarum]|nr:hypothetical protein MP228_002898 [Amoeboaphelidium protococcarum]